MKRRQDESINLQFWEMNFALLTQRLSALNFGFYARREWLAARYVVENGFSGCGSSVIEELNGWGAIRAAGLNIIGAVCWVAISLIFASLLILRSKFTAKVQKTQTKSWNFPNYSISVFSYETKSSTSVAYLDLQTTMQINFNDSISQTSNANICVCRLQSDPATNSSYLLTFLHPKHLGAADVYLTRRHFNFVSFVFRSAILE